MPPCIYIWLALLYYIPFLLLLPQPSSSSFGGLGRRQITCFFPFFFSPFLLYNITGSFSLSLMALLLETFSKSANSFWHFSLFFASSSSLHRIVDAVVLLLSAFSFAGFCGSIPIDVARVHIRWQWKPFNRFKSHQMKKYPPTFALPVREKETQSPL